MKKLLIISAVGLALFATKAQAQILGLSVGRHGFSVGVGAPAYCAPPPVVYSAPPVCAPPTAYYQAPPVYAYPPPAVVYSYPYSYGYGYGYGPRVAVGRSPGRHGYHHYGGRGAWHR